MIRIASYEQALRYLAFFQLLSTLDLYMAVLYYRRIASPDVLSQQNLSASFSSSLELYAGRGSLTDLFQILICTAKNFDWVISFLIVHII